jgi:cobalt-zinc-cadmium efflux system membrane fusion protein
MKRVLTTWTPRFRSAGILALLALLAYWGHSTHWKLPSFNDLLGGGADDNGKRAAKDARTKEVNGQEFPSIIFDSVAQVRQAGLECETVRVEPVDQFVEANAVVGYDQTKVAQLSSRVPGFVWKVTVQVGQFVHEGDVLALVDSQEVGQAKADFMHEYAASTFAATRLERLRGQFKDAAASEATLREAERTLWEARVRRFNAQQKLVNLGFQIDLGQWKDEEPEKLAQRIQVLGLPEKVVKLLKPRPNTTTLMPLYAPFDGVITQYDLVVGERITPEQAQVAMADVRSMWINLGVRKEDARQLDFGQSVFYIGSGAHGKCVEGKVIWISTEVDEKTRTVPIRAQANNISLASADKEMKKGPWLLRANEYGSAHVHIAHHANAVMVPNKAIQRLHGKTLVFVVDSEGKTFEPRLVELGVSGAMLCPGNHGDLRPAETLEGFTHVRSGLRPGERIATTNSFVLKSELMKDALVAQ